MCSHSVIPSEVEQSLDPMPDEGKTLEERTQTTDLERLRHSASHVLAPAILKIWPEAQFAAEPPVKTVFIMASIFPTAFFPSSL
jgi:threonyl-tRNA synthetase